MKRAKMRSLPGKIIVIGVRWLTTTWIFLNAGLSAEELGLEGQWLFKLGDDSTWSQLAFNDSGWFPLKVPGYWENQHYEDYDGFAWYRYHFAVKTSLLDQESLVLLLGKIDDADEVFLNGTRIGGSGVFPPHFFSEKNSLRRYSVPGKLLRSENVLAVRVYDDGQKGGIFSGPIRLITAHEPRSSAPDGTTLENSYYQLPFSNGIAAGNYNLKTRTFTHFLPHLYRRFDAKTETINLINQARLVLFREGVGEVALTALKMTDAGYIEGTGIIKQVLAGRDFTLTQYAFCPFNLDKPFWVIFAVLDGAIEELTLNFSLSSSEVNLDVGKWAYQQAQRKWLTVFIYYNREPATDEYLFLRKYKNEHPGFQALTDEIAWWQSWQKGTRMPERLSPPERQAYLQSLAVLKMAQCREPFPAGGQIVAALPPASQNYCQVRDQAHAVEALLAAGHYDEARAALQFIMNSRAGRYKVFQWSGKNSGLGVDYAVSIYRYLGNGLEESLSDENGLTMHLDGMGLTLWNLNRYVDMTGDQKFIKYYWPKISRYIADVLLALIDDTGLVRAEPGPWEKSVPFRHYTYTSACIYRGLLDAAQLARLMDDEARAQSYEDAAVNLRINLERKMFDSEVRTLKGSLEETNPNLYMDLTVVEALNWIFNPQDEINRNTLSALKQYLSLNSPPRGYYRTRTESAASRHEWVYGNLRTIAAIRKAANIAEADTLLQWYTLQTIHNFGLIPQYYDARSGDYLGVVPRVGLGAGVYLQNLWRP